MKNKIQNKSNDDVSEIKTLVIITLIIVIVSVGLYYLTEKSLNKKNAPEEIPEAIINYSEALVGTMFDRPYKEYYVFIYSEQDEDAYKLDDLFSSYEEKEGAKKIFYVDLDNAFNVFIKSEKSNPKPTKPSEVKVKDKALILIKDGKVTKFYESIKEIEKVLK